MYEPVTKEGAAYAKGLTEIWNKLGRPEDASVATGWIMIDNIIPVWIKAFPQEYYDFRESIKRDLETERTPFQAGDNGYFPISYPTALFSMIKACLPKQKMNDDKFIQQMTRRYPMFKSTNY